MSGARRQIDSPYFYPNRETALTSAIVLSPKKEERGLRNSMKRVVLHLLGLGPKLSKSLPVIRQVLVCRAPNNSE